jgi:hypothetical protein
MLLMDFGMLKPCRSLKGENSTLILSMDAAIASAGRSSEAPGDGREKTEAHFAPAESVSPHKERFPQRQ